MTIDIQARTHALSLLERIQDERLTYLELEYEWPVSDDPSLDGILRWIWSECREPYNSPVFDSLSDQHLSIFKNCAEFLATDHEFPMRTLSWSQALQERLTWGMDWNIYCSLPDYPEWPLPLKKSDDHSTP